jgi:small subunit ribosomal protein S9
MVAQKQSKASSVQSNVPLAHSVGRRKKAVARIWLRRGKGKIMINGKDYADYFDTEKSRLNVLKPMLAVPQAAHYYLLMKRYVLFYVNMDY